MDLGERARYKGTLYRYSVMRMQNIMAFVFHIHTSPSCETTHNTACSSVDGSDWDHSCVQITSGRNRGKFGCIHRNPQGLTRDEEIFISDLISLQVFARDQGGYRKTNRP
jgi:hypothetical protein